MKLEFKVGDIVTILPKLGCKCHICDRIKNHGGKIVHIGGGNRSVKIAPLDVDVFDIHALPEYGIEFIDHVSKVKQIENKLLNLT